MLSAVYEFGGSPAKLQNDGGTRLVHSIPSKRTQNRPRVNWFCQQKKWKKIDFKANWVFVVVFVMFSHTVVFGTRWSCIYQKCTVQFVCQCEVFRVQFGRGGRVLLSDLFKNFKKYCSNAFVTARIWIFSVDTRLFQHHGCIQINLKKIKNCWKIELVIVDEILFNIFDSKLFKILNLIVIGSI